MDGVSFVVCTYNGGRRLPAVLERLAQQDKSADLSAEVLIIDNASTDDTVEVARRCWSRTDIPLRIIAEPRKGLSYARVTGFNASRYEAICFIDDDNWVTPGWMVGIASIMANHPTVGACGGYIVPVCEIPAPSWFETAKERYATSTESREQGVITEAGAFLAGAGLTVRRSAWEQLRDGGFQFRAIDRRGDELSSGGDAELCLALKLAGWDLWFDYSLTLEHFLPAGRLCWPYARRLYRGCASCAAILDAYLHVLTRPLPPRTRMDQYRKTGGARWLWHAASAFRRLITNPGSLLAALGRAENNLDVLQIEMNYGRLLSYLQHRSEYDRAVRELTGAAWRRRP